MTTLFGEFAQFLLICLKWAGRDLPIGTLKTHFAPRIVNFMEHIKHSRLIEKTTKPLLQHITKLEGSRAARGDLEPCREIYPSPYIDTYVHDFKTIACIYQDISILHGSL